MKVKKNISGFTLVELLISIMFFGVLSTIMYETFNIISYHASSSTITNSLYDKGQRLLQFIEDDISMIGFLLGPDARIPYCTNGTIPSEPNVLTVTKNNPYDTLTFLTSIPVTLKENSTCMSGQKNCGDVSSRIDYFLTTKCETLEGANPIEVDAGKTCYDDMLVVNVDSKINGKSLITFDSLRLSGAAVAGSPQQVYYTLDTLGIELTTKEALQQRIPDNSTVYTIRQFRYEVLTDNGQRTLRRVGWDENCNNTGGVVANLIESSGTNGGIDGLKFEFTYLDTITGNIVTSDTLPPLTQLKSVTVWVLLRADRPEKNYKDTKKYTLGVTSNKLVLGPYNDNYRRLLLQKTVEVKNLAPIS